MENKKRTILISALLVLFCVALCVGATLAFFTDAIVSKTNKVQAGTLKVDFELLTKGTENDWVSIKSNNEPIFDYSLWEKGYTDVKILRVENEGDLAIEWQAVYGSQKELSELAQAINVYLKTSNEPFSYPATREELADWNTWQGTLDQFIQDISTILLGELKGGESAYLGIALQMQTDADDDKYGLTIGEFDIHIVAKQLTSEEDFFGADYDENAEFPCMHINTYINVVKGATEATETEPAKAGIQQIVCSMCGEVFGEEPCYLTFNYVENNKNGDYYSVGSLIDICTDTKIIIPDKYSNIPIGSIGAAAFKDNLQIISVTISDSITRIEDSAFFGCSNLVTANLSDSVVFLGANSFKNCSSLTSIKIPEGVTSINSDAFYGCRSLSNVELPNSVTVIGFRSFEFCTSLMTIDLPDGLLATYQYAFYGSGLTSIDIPDSVTRLTHGTFQECRNLKSVKLPTGITILETYMFYNCKALESISIPSSVISMGQGVFNGCSSLTSVTMADGIQNIGVTAFNGCTALTNIEIPNSVTSIGYSAFANCKSLVEITIPESVIDIGSGVFEGCNGLRYVSLPGHITIIEERTFKNCKSLTTLHFNGTILQWESITLGTEWNTNTPQTLVIDCFDGAIAQDGSVVTKE